MNTKKRFGVSVILLMLVLAVSAYAATLPSQGGSNNVWGTELNTWLQVAHDSTGAIQSNYVTSAMINDQTIAAGDIAPGAVNITHFGAITEINTTHLASGSITTAGTEIEQNISLRGLNVSTNGSVIRGVFAGTGTCGSAILFNSSTSTSAFLTMFSSPELVICSVQGASNDTVICSVFAINATGFNTKCKGFPGTGMAVDNTTATFQYIAIDL